MLQHYKKYQYLRRYFRYSPSIKTTYTIHSVTVQSAHCTKFMVIALLHTAHSAVLNRNLFTSLLRCLVLCAVELVHPLHQLSFYIPGSVLFEMFSILYPLSTPPHLSHLFFPVDFPSLFFIVTYLDLCRDINVTCTV